MEKVFAYITFTEFISLSQLIHFCRVKSYCSSRWFYIPLFHCFWLERVFFSDGFNRIAFIIMEEYFFNSLHNLLDFKAFHVSLRIEDSSVMCVWFCNVLLTFQPFVTLKSRTPYLTFFTASLNYFEE